MVLVNMNTFMIQYVCMYMHHGKFKSFVLCTYIELILYIAKQNNKKPLFIANVYISTDPAKQELLKLFFLAKQEGLLSTEFPWLVNYPLEETVRETMIETNAHVTNEFGK